jgi:hypothetical protein
VFFLPLLFLDTDRCVLSARALLIVGLLCSFCPYFSYSRTVVFFFCPCLSLCESSGAFSATVLLIIVSDLCTLCPCLSLCKSIGTFSILITYRTVATGLVCSLHLLISVYIFWDFSVTLLLIMQSAWCSHYPCLSLCEIYRDLFYYSIAFHTVGLVSSFILSFFETFITFSAIAYHSVNLAGPVSPLLSQCLPFCTFFDTLPSLSLIYLT